MFKNLLSRSPAAPSAASTQSLVLSVPPKHRQALAERCACLSTFEALSALLAGARRSVHIFSPYVDPTFTSLAHAVAPSVPVRVVSTAREGRAGRPNAVLERCAQDRDLQVRYLVERRHNAQMFQMHAKLVAVDGSAAYVGSANLTDTSVHYNLELGILLRLPEQVASLEALFAFVWDTMALPAHRLWPKR